MSGTGYDYSVTTFSPEGRVYQVEYAEKATEKAGTVIAIKCTDGVVMGVEKPITSKLLKPDANKLIIPIGTYAAMAFSGIQPDGRALANDAKAKVKDFHEFYGTHIPGHNLASRIAGRVHNTTIYWPERPFGVNSTLTVYDVDKKECELYQIDPTGRVARYFASATGRHRQSARTELEKIDFKTVTVKEAVELIALILYKLHDDIKDRDFEIEMVWQTQESSFKVQSVPKNIRDEAVVKAKEAKERALMEDDDEMAD